MCKKKGELTNDTQSDKLCPPEEVSNPVVNFPERNEPSLVKDDI